MPIHEIAQYFTELYGPDEDQVSSYPSQNSGNDDTTDAKGISDGSLYEDIMYNDKEAAEVEVKWLQVRRAQDKDVAFTKEVEL